MEKTIKIDDKNVKFKTNGVALLVYKQQTGRDLMPDLFALIGTSNVHQLNRESIDLTGLNVQVLFDICWTFAKIADSSIPPVLEWAGSFESFPVIDVFYNIMELVTECITCSAEVKKKVANAELMKVTKHSKQKQSFFRRHK